MQAIGSSTNPRASTVNTLPGNALPENALPENALPENALPENALPGNIPQQSSQLVQPSLVQHIFKALKHKLPLLLSSLWLCSCTAHSAPETRSLTLQQQWSLNPGDEIAGNIVSGSLGDISIYLKEGRINAPFDGELEPSEVKQCTLYSSAEIPAYLFRLCGLKKVAYGEIKAGKRIGKGDVLSFATMRRQPDGTWIIVEPARGVLEKALEK